MSETLHSRNRAHIAEEMRLGNNVISRSVKVRTDTKMNIMKTEALSGHGLNVTGVAGQQKPIATNTSQRITGTRARRKGEPMNLNMKPDTALTILHKILRRTHDTWEHDALVLAIEALKEVNKHGKDNDVDI